MGDGLLLLKIALLSAYLVGTLVRDALVAYFLLLHLLAVLRQSTGQVTLAGLNTMLPATTPATPRVSSVALRALAFSF